MPLPRRYSRPVVVIAFALCLALFVLVGKRGSHTDWATNGRRLGPHAFLKSSGQLSTGYAEAAHLTTVLAHQPGFTLFKNLYWQNDTYYVITDQPWSVPDVDHIAIRTTPKRDGIPTDNKVVRVLAVRGPPINAFVQESKQLGTTISLDGALRLAQEAEELPSPMIINHDDNFVSHYYHWIGETFLGAWRLWSHYMYRTGLNLPDFKTVAFRYMYDMEDVPLDLGYGYEWEDHAGANRFFMEKWFPGVTIESKPVWDERAQSNQLYRIPIVVLANRWAGHRGPSAAWKPWGDVLRMPVHPDYLLGLRARVLKKYRGPVSLKRSKLPRVKYLMRQDTTRKLTDESHEALLDALQDLHDEGLVQVSALHFTDGDSFEDQLAHMATTDFLIGVHGNGLTHALWMTPGPCKGVFEIQPKHCSLNDFSPLAMAAGVTHYLVAEDSLCTLHQCPDRGCGGDPRGPNRDDLVVDPTVITEQIRRLVQRHWKNGVEVE